MQRQKDEDPTWAYGSRHERLLFLLWFFVYSVKEKDTSRLEAGFLRDAKKDKVGVSSSFLLLWSVVLHAFCLRRHNPTEKTASVVFLIIQYISGVPEKTLTILHGTFHIFRNTTAKLVRVFFIFCFDVGRKKTDQSMSEWWNWRLQQRILNKDAL